MPIIRVDKVIIDERKKCDRRCVVIRWSNEEV